MSEFLNVMIFPHQRRKHVQAELERLGRGALPGGPLDPLQLEWAERREGVLVRWSGSVQDTSLPRILSGRLNGPVLLAYVCDHAVWGYQLHYKGSPVDFFDTAPGCFGPAPTDPPEPKRRAAKLAQYFTAGREDLWPYLVPWTLEEREGGGAPAYPGDAHPRGDCWQLEDFLRTLAPWTRGMLTASRLDPAAHVPVPDNSSPAENAPDRGAGQRPPKKEPGPETCLPFLTAVQAVRRERAAPLLRALFSRKRPAPETIPHEGWTARELEAVLDRFQSQELDRLELDFILPGEGTYVRRLRKIVCPTFYVTLELLREEGRCMCLVFDDQDSSVYRLIADVDTYMTVDSKQLPQTVFHGQTVEEYVVFPEPCSETVRREVLFLLARIDHRDDVLSAIRRNGVWSCEGNLANTDTAKRRQQEIRRLWCIE